LLLSVYGLSQNTFVPDDNFEQALIDLGFDIGPLDDMVPTTNISNITSLDVEAKGISDLTGIEDFLGLEVLNCEDNLLSVLDVTNNLSLTQLFCSTNNINSIDVSLLVNLQIFWCSNNQLTNLNVTQNTKLFSLVCGNNQLTNLDVTNNPTLNVLVFENNQITTIDVSKNLTLTNFNCSQNFLTTLDITNNLNLVNFDCSTNQIDIIDTSKNQLLNNINVIFNLLKELDLSKNTQVTDINCSENNLCRINIKNGNNNTINVFDFSNNPNLNCVVVDNPSSDHSSWFPITFTNYVASINDCNVFVNVDSLPNFIGISYMLPYISNGNYFTESGGLGIPLFVGNIIDTSQTIYIYNETVCDSNESSFNVLITNDSYYIPKYFTPNNDGNHDLWWVSDFDNNMQKIEVFDQYGKFIKYLQPNIGWNGTFNGKPLGSNDYWYVITFITGETLRGHFTLKR